MSLLHRNAGRRRSGDGRRAAPGRAAAAVLLATLLVSCVLYAGFLRPLPAHSLSCIPNSLRADSSEPADLVPGDPLQLLYHFELVRQFFAGEVPPFRNLWEFNVSDDARPARFDPFYAPFSVPYALLRLLGASDAAAWNAVQFFSVWLGVLFCFLLARRFGATPGGALLVAALAGCVPYRWIVLAEGSPSGFGMGLVPGFVLGVDIAVRDRSPKGGLLAGVLLVCLYAADLHCALFAALSLPFWLLLSAALSPDAFRKGNRPRLARALAPLAAGFAVVVFAGLAAGRAAYAGTNVEAGRTFGEIAVHSPELRTLFHPRHPSPLQGHLYAGPVLAGLFAAAAAALALGWRKRPRAAVAGALLVAAVLFAFSLSLGANGPCRGLPVRALRALVPPLRLVRQPIKVLCLLPSGLAVLWSLALAGAERLRRLPRGVRAALGAVLLVPAFLSARAGMTTGLTRLVGPNRAYDAAVRAAEAEGKTARALVLPLTRGDSVYAAPYLYWAQRSGLRMLDGYAAVRSLEYEKTVWEPFKSLEGGSVPDGRCRQLLGMGVTAVLIDGNVLAFAKRPDPVENRVARMRDDPHLRFLASDRGTWAFALVPESGAASSPTPEEKP